MEGESNEMPGAPHRRLDVLSRQLTAAAADGAALPNVCPRAMFNFIVHDNPELRQKIYEHLKARRKAKLGVLGCFCCKFCCGARLARDSKAPQRSGDW